MKIEMKGLSIPKRYRLILVIVLDILILVGAYFFVYDDQYQQKKRLEADVSAAQQELNKLIAVKNDIEKARKEYAQLKVTLQDLIRQMPEEKEVPNLLRQVSFTAQQARTRIRYFAPREAQPRDFYSELPFEIKYSAPYHSIGYFFDGVRKMERIVHVTSFSLESRSTGQRNMLEGTCLAKTYVFRKDAPKEKPLEKKKEEKSEPPKK